MLWVKTHVGSSPTSGNDEQSEELTEAGKLLCLLGGLESRSHVFSAEK